MNKKATIPANIPTQKQLLDPVVTKGGDAGRLESEVAEIVFNPEVSDLEYFLSRKRYFERLGKLATSVGHGGDKV